MSDFINPNPTVLALVNWSYNQIAPPEITPIDIADLKSHLRIDEVDDGQESYLNILIGTAVKYAENYMNRRLITQTWRTYRNNFLDEPCIEIQRNRFQKLTLFKYYDQNGVLQDLLPQLNTMYYITDEPDGYSQIIPLPGQMFPSIGQIQQRKQAVIIEFKLGYGDLKTDVPSPLKMALLNHCAFLYANRGDSDNAGSEASGGSIDNSSLASVPNASMAIYNQYRIRDFATNVTI
jgi:uncharacterized phiE125 gp8 family phage protein